MSKIGFGNVYFINEAAQHYYLNQFSEDKLQEIEMIAADDFIESFQEWVEKRDLNELFLIWSVLRELENDTLKLEELIQQQIIKFKRPIWLALCGTLAFYSVHYLNKILIEEEFKNRSIVFDSYTTLDETVIATNNKVFKVKRYLLMDLKLGIYHDQLSKEYFQDLADTMTALTFH